MTRPKPELYPLRESSALSSLCSALRERFDVREEPRARRTTTYFDTFDWRLHRAGATLSLVTLGRTRRLILARGRDEIVASAVAGEPDFAAALPASLRPHLEPVIAARRLLPIAIVEAEVIALRLIDKEEKTVARIALEETRTRPPRRRVVAKTALARLLPVKGYDRASARAARILAERSGTPPCEGGDLELALAALGRLPGDYVSKPSVAFDPEERTDRAVKQALEALREVIVRNEAGVLADLDSEFLHDYRVAVRRTRSALGQVKNIFAVRTLARFKRGFAWLGSVTGPCRDLDVLLLSLGAEGDLAAEDRASLAPLRAHFRAEKQRQHRRMVRAFGSARYRRLLDDWRDFLAAEVPESTRLSNAERPVAEVARERIWKAYRSCVKHGRAITEDSPIELLHRLRIDCKKLRYLLELFAGLLPQRHLAALIRQLKRLQDNLGGLNDCGVQREALRTAATVLAADAAAPSDTLLAMGALLGRIDEREATERGLFASRFEQFDTAPNRRSLRRLLRGEPGGGSS